ncbi:MAG: hypothetical protein IJ661_07830 [Lachnospiraceae bacterium]|nr:hypothetical protein [Lachnospiraceae bacterium]
MWIVICIVIIIFIYLYCIAPNTGRQEQMQPFADTYIAHRGLFDNGDGEWEITPEGVTPNGGKAVSDSSKAVSDGKKSMSDKEKVMPNEKEALSDREKAMPEKKAVSDGGKAVSDSKKAEIIPENSMPAFERAVASGYGIELDTQTTKDGRLVVFHDETLYRMCGVDKKLYECTYEELMKYGLAGTDYRIPLFSDVLKAVGGRVPLIVEIKSEGNWLRTTRMTAEQLDAYRGIYCVESFHPLVVRWFRKNRPDVLRGQLSTNFFRSTLKRAWYENIILTNLMLNFLSRPDFVAYNYRYRNQPSFWLCRHLFNVVSAAWTVRSEAVLKRVSKVFDVIIFDSFIPGERE